MGQSPQEQLQIFNLFLHFFRHLVKDFGKFPDFILALHRRPLAEISVTNLYRGLCQLIQRHQRLMGQEKSGGHGYQPDTCAKQGQIRGTPFYFLIIGRNILSHQHIVAGELGDFSLHQQHCLFSQMLNQIRLLQDIGSQNLIIGQIDDALTPFQQSIAIFIALSELVFQIRLSGDIPHGLKIFPGANLRKHIGN